MNGFMRDAYSNFDYSLSFYFHIYGVSKYQPKHRIANKAKY